MEPTYPKPPDTIIHQTLNGKYRVKIERVGSAKGTLGYIVEANGDILSEVANDAFKLRQMVEAETHKAEAEAPHE